jgi:hypothetical protein
MTRSLPKIWVAGVAVIALAQVAWFVLLGMQRFSQTLFVLLWVSSGIAALMVAYFSPRRKIVMGLSLSVPTAVLIAVLNYGYQLTGHASDFPGIRGAVILLTMEFAWNAVICGIGAAAGYFLARAIKR